MKDGILHFRPSTHLTHNPAANAAVTDTGYTHDADSSNITNKSENTVNKVNYYYDTDNQLVREDNSWINETIANVGFAYWVIVPKM